MDDKNQVNGNNEQQVSQVPIASPVTPEVQTPITPLAAALPTQETPVVQQQVEQLQAVQTQAVQPQVEQAQETAVPTETQETPTEEKKKPNIVIIAIIAIAVILIGTGVCFALGVFGGEKEKESPSTPNPTPPVIEDDTIQNVDVNIDTTPRSGVSAKDFNGIYQSGKTVIKIYAIADDNIVFDIIPDSLNGGVSGYARLENDKISGNVFEVYTFVLYNEGIGLETSNSEIQEKTYKKMKDYTKEDYYTDTYGDLTLLNGEYNWQYKDDKCELYAYQSDESSIFYEVSCDKGEVFYSYGGIAERTDTQNVFEDGTFDEVKRFTYEGDNLIISSEGVEEDFLSGTYTKVKQLTIDDVIEHINR